MCFELLYTQTEWDNQGVKWHWMVNAMGINCVVGNRTVTIMPKQSECYRAFLNVPYVK